MSDQTTNLTNPQVEQQSEQVEQQSEQVEQQPITKPVQQFRTANGVKPLYFAGIIFYQNVLVPALETAVANFDKWQNDVNKSKFSYVTVHLPDMHDQVIITCDDSTEKAYTVADVYYAPRKQKGRFTDRDFEAWPRMGTLSPFRSAQQLMLQSGFYLVEESDPDVSKKVILKLYKTVSPYPEKKLWHDHNKIFGVYTPKQAQNTENSTEKPTKTNYEFKKKNNYKTREPRQTYVKQPHKQFTNSFDPNEFPTLPNSENVPLRKLDVDNTWTNRETNKPENNESE